jgi:predicted ATPase
LRVRVKNQRGANARVASVDVGEICQRTGRNENFLPISQRSRIITSEDVRYMRIEANGEVAHLRRQAEHSRFRRNNKCLVHSKRW